MEKKKFKIIIVESKYEFLLNWLSRHHIPDDLITIEILDDNQSVDTADLIIVDELETLMDLKLPTLELKPHSIELPIPQVKHFDHNRGVIPPNYRPKHKRR